MSRILVGAGETVVKAVCAGLGRSGSNALEMLVRVAGEGGMGGSARDLWSCWRMKRYGNRPKRRCWR